MHIGSKKRIYLDYASATPMRKEVVRAMKPYLTAHFANPSAIYKEGVEARRALEEARTVVAQSVHAGAKDVVFTSGGTEADNLAILGTFEQLKEHVGRPHIIVTEYDHPAIVEAAREAERRGAELSIVPAHEVVQHMKSETILVSMSYCNSETGEIAPVSAIGRAVRDMRKGNGNAYPYFHVDVSQAITTQRINVDTLRADLLTLDGGKIYGPKGIGALIVRPWARIRPLIVGGGQEKGLRSGTENVAAAVGLACALSLLETERDEYSERVAQLRERFVEMFTAQIDRGEVNGGTYTVPNIVSVTLPGALHEFLAIALAEHGVDVSTGSSCGSLKNNDEKEALRFSFGRETRASDIEYAIRNLKRILV